MDVGVSNKQVGKVKQNLSTRSNTHFLILDYC